MGLGTCFSSTCIITFTQLAASCTICVQGGVRPERGREGEGGRGREREGEGERERKRRGDEKRIDALPSRAHLYVYAPTCVCVCMCMHLHVCAPICDRTLHVCARIDTCMVCVCACVQHTVVHTSANSRICECQFTNLRVPISEQQDHHAIQDPS